MHSKILANNSPNVNGKTINYQLPFLFFLLLSLLLLLVLLLQLLLVICLLSLSLLFVISSDSSNLPTYPHYKCFFMVFFMNIIFFFSSVDEH